jgi:hypothetical protein
MSRPLATFLAGDHARLDGLLRRAMTEASTTDRAAYTEFRAGLLRHISLEEKILLPAAQRWQGGDPLPPGGVWHGVDRRLPVPDGWNALARRRTSRPRVGGNM